jgi:hypothetical protein
MECTRENIMELCISISIALGRRKSTLAGYMMCREPFMYSRNIGNKLFQFLIEPPSVDELKRRLSIVALENS